MTTPVLFELKNGVAFLALNRPDRLNAFNRPMALDLQQKLDDCATDPAVRCIYLTGTGKAFCAGQDLSEAIEKNDTGIDQMVSHYYNPIVMRIREMEKPVVAAVNGVAAGAGANIAFCCDIVLAAHSAYFVQSFSKLGLVPDSGGTYFLPRLIGWQKASALMMLAEKVSAGEAEKLGMIYRVLPDDSFAELSVGIAEKLAQMPTRGLALTKQALHSSFTNSLEAQLSVEAALQQQAAKTKDFHEGVKAFLEKRQPEFKGE